VDGRFTGGIVGEPCYGAGKRIWGERIAAEHGAPMRDCTFYTDSFSDLALLEAVGHPVAVNPDVRLRRRAHERGWPIQRFY
jgi:phosphoserine phosphatase